MCDRSDETDTFLLEDKPIFLSDDLNKNTFHLEGPPPACDRSKTLAI